jgi:hypothetical protein
MQSPKIKVQLLISENKVTVAEGNHAASCSYHTVQRKKQADISPDAVSQY